MEGGSYRKRGKGREGREGEKEGEGKRKGG